MAAPAGSDRAMLASRIQGFGNVNPPPLEEETGSTIAKRAVGRLGDMVGEEVMLTVEDFREKGAVGAVKDAVADAGDILIDGVSGLIGWIRGDAPVEEEDAEKAEEATKALSNGPGGAAYGISQASPTGGINAVWVMPDEADPAALAQLTAQSGSGLVQQQNDPRVPKNIQPYQPPPKQGAAAPSPMVPSAFPGMMQIPGGPVIAPYQPAPSGPAGRAPPFIPGAAGYGGNKFPAAGAGWGPSGYSPDAGGAASSSLSSGAPAAGAKGLVERIAKGEVLVGPDVAKRLVSQCQATKTTGKQLGELVCERARRLYLGLDGGDPADGDASLARLLGLADALAQQDADVARAAIQEIKQGVSEELLSLRSSAKHKDAAEPLLARLFKGGAQADSAAEVDLLGGGAASAAAAGSSQGLLEADLLGGGGSTAPAADASADLLGGVSSASPLASAGVASLDPLSAPAAPVAGSSSNILAGLSLDTSPSMPTMPAAGASPMAAMPAMGSSPVFAPPVGQMQFVPKAAPKEKKEDEMFGFVGAEMSKASSKA